MASEESSSKDRKMEIAVENDQMTSPTSGLSRQGSLAKSNCLCSPTTHAGSFRCRLHRAPSLQRTKSIDSSSKANASHSAANNAKSVEAQ